MLPISPIPGMFALGKAVTRKAPLMRWLLVVALLVQAALSGMPKIVTIIHAHEEPHSVAELVETHSLDEDSDHADSPAHDHDDSGKALHKHHVLTAGSLNLGVQEVGSFQSLVTSQQVKLSIQEQKVPEAPVYELIKPPQIG